MNTEIMNTEIVNENQADVKLTPQQEYVLQQLMASDPFRDETESRDMVLTYVVPDIGTPEKFMVTDRASANWVLRKLAECDQDEAAIRDMADQELNALQTRVKKLLEPIERRRQFFTEAYVPQVEEWAKSELEGKKEKSIGLIHGKVGFRKQPESVIIADEKAVIDYLESNPDIDTAEAIRVKKEVNKSYLKTYLTEHMEEGQPYPMLLGTVIGEEGPETGEIAGVYGGGDKFYVKPEMPKGGD